MSDEKRGHYIPEHRKAEIVENTDLSWKAYQNIPTEQQRQEFVKQLLGNLENQGFTINDVDLNDVDYNTFYNIYSDKSTIESARKTEQIEAEKKAAEEVIVADAFSDADSEPDSQSAKDVCEVCDAEKLKCLCHVEITSPLRKEKYFWKAGSTGELAGNNMSIIGVMFSETGEKKSDKPEFKPFKLKFGVVNSKCRGPKGPFPDKCTNFYYYEMDSNELLIGDVHEKDQSGTLALEFNKDYLNNKKKPVYLKALDDDKSKTNSTKIAFEKAADGPDKLTNIKLKYEVSTPSKVIPLSTFEPFFHRAINFALWGKLDYMPVSIFRTVVLECKYGDMSSITKKNVPINHDFDQAKATVYVLPSYEVEHEITLDFGTLTGETLTKTFLKGSIKKTISESMSLTFSLKEKFNGEDSNSFEGKIADVVGFSQKLFKKYEPFSIITDAIGTVFSLEDLSASYSLYKEDATKVKQEVKKDKLITFKGDLPKIKLKGTSALAIKDNQLTVVRKEATLTAEPLFGGGVIINLVTILLKAIPPLNKAYEEANRTTTFINDLDFGMRLDVSTDQYYLDRLSDEAKKQKENASVDISLIIYGNFYMDCTYGISWDLEGDELFKSSIRVKEGAVDATIGFRAGASFRMKFWVFQGAFSADLDVFTGLRVGDRYITRKKDGKEERIPTSYTLFKGLGVKWELKASIGTKTNNESVDNELGIGDIEIGSSDHIPSSQRASYDDLQSAKNRRDELLNKQKAMDDAIDKVGGKIDIMDYAATYDYKKLEEDSLKRYNDALQYYPPGFTDNELYELKRLDGTKFSIGHIKMYENNQTKLTRIAQINRELDNTTGAKRNTILREKHRLMSEVTKETKYANLPHKPDSFYRKDMNKEYDERDDSIYAIDKEIAVLKKDKMDNITDDDLKKAYQKRIEQLEKEKKSIYNLPDDEGRRRLFPAKLLGAQNLLASERRTLYQELVTEMGDRKS